MHSMKGMN